MGKLIKPGFHMDEDHVRAVKHHAIEEGKPAYVIVGLALDEYFEKRKLPIPRTPDETSGP